MKCILCSLPLSSIEKSYKTIGLSVNLLVWKFSMKTTTWVWNLVINDISLSKFQQFGVKRRWICLIWNNFLLFGSLYSLSMMWIPCSILSLDLRCFLLGALVKIIIGFCNALGIIANTLHPIFYLTLSALWG